MSERRRFKQQLPLQDRLASFAKTARELAALLPPGAEKDELLRKAHSADTIAGLEQKSLGSTAQRPLIVRLSRHVRKVCAPILINHDDGHFTVKYVAG